MRPLSGVASAPPATEALVAKTLVGGGEGGKGGAVAAGEGLSLQQLRERVLAAMADREVAAVSVTLLELEVVKALGGSLGGGAGGGRLWVEIWPEGLSMDTLAATAHLEHLNPGPPPQPLARSLQLSPPPAVGSPPVTLRDPSDAATTDRGDRWDRGVALLPTRFVRRQPLSPAVAGAVVGGGVRTGSELADEAERRYC
ncbi:hypothetical protein T492DRAFT_471032 [Pavlovales sp. CCMP2436]|nr:hypothetical protein T492DRAFT_471032 [Pavlovales sp. CCMP2436]